MRLDRPRGTKIALQAIATFRDVTEIVFIRAAFTNEWDTGGN